MGSPLPSLSALMQRVQKDWDSASAAILTSTQQPTHHPPTQDHPSSTQNLLSTQNSSTQNLLSTQYSSTSLRPPPSQPRNTHDVATLLHLQGHNTPPSMATISTTSSASTTSSNTPSTADGQIHTDPSKTPRISLDYIMHSASGSHDIGHAPDLHPSAEAHAHNKSAISTQHRLYPPLSESKFSKKRGPRAKPPVESPSKHLSKHPSEHPSESLSESQSDSHLKRISNPPINEAQPRSVRRRRSRSTTVHEPQRITTEQYRRMVEQNTAEDEEILRFIMLSRSPSK